MFDLGWTELLVIGIVALIVVGPKDLPGMFRTVGNFVGKAKGMARDFSKAMNDAADEAGVRDVSNTFKKASNPIGSAMDEVRKTAKEATDSFTQVNLGLGVDLTESIRLSVNAQNVFDEDVQQHVFGDLLARKVSGRLRFAF